MTEKHVIPVEDEEGVASVHHEADSDNWIFFCHGFGSNKEGSYEERCKRAVEEGFNAVRFDFRGNGESDGEFIDQTLSSKIKDLKSVVEYFEPSNFALFGSSFGGKTVIHSLDDLNAEAAVLRAPVLLNDTMEKYENVVSETGSFTHHGEKTIDMKFVEDFQAYSFEEASDNISCPVFIFHGGTDTTVHFEKTADASKKMNNHLEIVKFQGENHSFSENTELQMREKMFQNLTESL